MGKSIKYKPEYWCAGIFTFCLAVRLIEYFFIKTDQTAIGENVLHKVVGVLILAWALKKTGLSWRDIGFPRNGSARGIFKGLLLGSICFLIAYGVEFAVLALQGQSAHFEVYISGFSLTGMPIKHTGLAFFTLCVLCNAINVWMEEGVFRGFFIRTLTETRPFAQADLIAAFLFGLWHIVMPVRSYLSGELSFGGMLLMGAGYMLLSGLMGIKWGLLFRMTGNIWVGAGDHFFNNTIATNALHVVSQRGADELQIVRIMAAQLISFAFVLALYRHKKADR